MKRIWYLLVFAFFFSLLLGIESRGQQTIFKVPTADVLDKGKVYVEIDAAFKLDREDLYGRFSSFVPRAVVGVGGRVEVGVNVTGNVQPGADSTAIVPTVKWKFHESEKSRIALFAGANFYIPSAIGAGGLYEFFMP
jgi:hypothetical protein